jgi:hypothetical protein
LSATRLAKELEAALRVARDPERAAGARAQANRGWELASRQGGQGSSGVTISDVKGEGRKGQPAGAHTNLPGAA